MQHYNTLSRRRLIKKGIVLATGSYILSSLNGISQSSSDISADTTKVLGAIPSNLGKRSKFATLERKVGRYDFDGYSMTPIEQLSGIMTPSDLHFERHHAGVPAIDPDRYELLIHGLVDRPLKFRLAELKRFPSETRTFFIECSGNGYITSFNKADIPEEISPGQLDGLFSVSEWTGVRLSTLFKEVGVHSKAAWFLAEGQDAAVLTRSIPIAKAWDDAMIVYGQNGESLRPEQGYPVRLLLPGWEGNTSVKWLRRIKVSDAPFMTRWETSRYSDAMSDGRIKMFTFTMGPKSIITSPSYPMILPEKGWYEIKGLAWSGKGRIRGVDISIDGGKNWKPATLQNPVLSKCATRFTFMWNWNGKDFVLMSRAVDETGSYQPLVLEARKGRGPGTYYHNNVVRPWRVGTDGRVTFGLGDFV